MNETRIAANRAYAAALAAYHERIAADRASLTRRYSFPDGKHRPIGDVRLILFAIASRLGLAGYPCPYCGTIAPTRWPWENGARHLVTCDGGRAEAARSTARYLRD